MKHSTTEPRQPHRRGVIAVLAAFLMVVLFAMVAFAVDLGYITLVKTQLQAAADSAALAAAGASGLSTSGMTAVAQGFANYHQVAGRSVALNASDVQMGSWDAGTRTFTASGQGGTAVKVTVRTATDSGGKTGLFFGKLFGLSAVSQQASAVATVNPRDIAFVVDLSGSMNDNTDPGDPSGSSDLIQQVYDDFGFGAYPGSSQWAGQPLGITSGGDWVYKLTKSGGPLRGASIPARYKVTSSTASANKTWKAYAWVMEVQMPAAAMMSSAVPAPYAGASYTQVGPNYNYWKTFIDQYPTQLGYLNYMTFMMYNGRDAKPDGTSYTPLSLQSNLCACPLHSESVGGTVFQFPPREMPTHACRRALIAAIQVVQNRNQTISDVNQRDWVSIITFDKVSSSSPKIEQSLTSDFSSVMTACTRLQAVSSNGLSTCTEAGLSLAQSHIKPASQGGVGREHTNKIVVLLTDGQPNLKTSSSTTITNYKNANPSTWTNPTTGQIIDNWAVTGSYTTEKSAALMQTSMMQGNGWYAYAVGVGLDCDSDFMNRVARMGATANPTTGQAPASAGDSTIAEANLTTIFNAIITNPKLRLVQ